MQIPFFKLSSQINKIKNELISSFNEVVNNDIYILGEKVSEFEQQFAEYCSSKYAVGVASGTDAIILSLKANGIQQGDEVITVSNTAIPTVTAIRLAGGIPKFADINLNNFNMDPKSLLKTITPDTKFVVVVNLYGRPAELDNIKQICDDNNIIMIEDCAQCHGAELNNKKTGTFGICGCFSFYPTKNLGCLGDGGLVVTDEKNIYEQLLLLRNYGQKSKYIQSVIGYNSRLDELQAAFLIKKLDYLDEYNNGRRKVAKIYLEQLKDIPGLIIPTSDNKTEKSVYHLFVVRVKERQKFQDYLNSKGIRTLIHYPKAIYLQEAYQDLGYSKGLNPNSELCCDEVVSLPVYPELTEKEINYICDTIKQYF